MFREVLQKKGGIAPLCHVKSRGSKARKHPDDPFWRIIVGGSGANTGRPNDGG